MADEFVIYELGGVPSGPDGSLFSNPVTTQYVDTGSQSSAFNANTKVVRLKNNGAATIYYKLGGSDVSAAAVTAGNMALFVGESEDVYLNRGETHIDTAS